MVDPRLPHGADLLVAGEAGYLGLELLVELPRRGRMASRGRIDLLVPPRAGERGLVRVPSEADVQHPPHAGLLSRGDDLVLRPLAEEEVGVRVDHVRQ
jgi:hypothetical protein